MVAARAHLRIARGGFETRVRPMSTLDASKSSARGRGIGGGTAGAPTSFDVIAATADGNRAREGGASVTATVLLSGLGAAGEPIACDVVDNGDGTYACSYVVHRRGDYSVSVELDGSPIAGSPFPVFFSAPPTAPAPAPGAPVPGAVPGAVPVVVPGVVPGVVQGASLFPGTADPPSAHQADEMQRTLCVKNVSSLVTVDQLRELFSFCGKVVECRVAGAENQFAFVEFETNAEAVKALGLNAMVLGDRAIRVEMSRTARRNQPVAAANPAKAPEVPAHVLEQQRRIADAQRHQAELLAKMAAERAVKRAAEIERRLSGDDADRRRRGSRSRSASRGRSKSRSPEGRGRRRDDSRSRSKSRSRSRSRDRRRGFGRRSRGGRRGRRRGRPGSLARSLSRDERSRSRDRSRGAGGGGGGGVDESRERRDDAKEGAKVDGGAVDAGGTRANATAAE